MEKSNECHIANSNLYAKEEWLRGWSIFLKKSTKICTAVKKPDIVMSGKEDRREGDDNDTAFQLNCGLKTQTILTAVYSWARKMSCTVDYCDR